MGITRSITSKLIVLLTLCSAFILTIGMFIDYRLSRDEILSRLQLEATETISGVVTDLENWLDGVEGATRFLGRVLEQREYSLAGLEQMLRDIVENNEDIYGAAIALNPDLVDEPEGFAPYYFRKGELLTSVNFADTATEYWRLPWYADAIEAGKPVWIEPYYDKGGGEVLMTTYSVPVYRSDDSGRRFLYAVVTADVALDELQLYLQRLRLGESGSGFLLSRDGIVLSARDPVNIMRHYLETGMGMQDTSTWIELVQRANSGSVATRQVKCPDQQGRCMTRVSALQSTQWPVGVIYSEDEILAPLRNYQIKTVVIGLLTLLFMALTVTIVSRRLTRPLTALVQITDQIAQGKFDIPLPRKQGEDEVARLIGAFDTMKINLKAFISDLESATAARSRLEGELATAREIQMAMLPKGGEADVRAAGYSLWATVRPAKTVGGDLYTYFDDDGDHLFIFLGDVSDKGVPAALFMAKTLSHIQQYSTAFSEPTRGMALLNNALEAGNTNCMFVTLFAGVLDLRSGELRFASAGHTTPCLLRQGKSNPVDQESGPALGLAADLEFPENTLQLRPGDRLTIYSDGIDEAFNDKGQMYGFERLQNELETSVSDETAIAGGKIINSIDRFAGSTAQSDDISLMLIELPSASRYEGRTGPTRNFARGSLLASRVGDWLESELQRLTSDKTLISELMLVSEEIVTNIDKYAGLAIEEKIRIAILPTPSMIALQFTDAGIAFNPLRDANQAALGRDIESAQIGGLGVHLITTMTDHQEYEHRDDCNILLISKAIN